MTKRFCIIQISFTRNKHQIISLIPFVYPGCAKFEIVNSVICCIGVSSRWGKCRRKFTIVTNYNCFTKTRAIPPRQCNQQANRSQYFTCVYQHSTSVQQTFEDTIFLFPSIAKKTYSKILADSLWPKLNPHQFLKHRLKTLVVNGLAEVRHFVSVGVEHSLVAVA